MQLETEMPELSSVWERVVEKHGLKKIGMEELVGNSWRFTDINWLETDYSAFVSSCGTILHMT